MRGTQIHYEATGDYDVIDIIQDYKLNFNRGNVVKYILRCGKKDDEIRELNKAKDYIKAGGSIEAIKTKYVMTAAVEKALKDA